MQTKIELRKYNDIVNQIDNMPLIERKKPISDFTPPTIILGKQKKEKPKIVSLADRIKKDGSEIIKQQEETYEVVDKITPDLLEKIPVEETIVEEKPIKKKRNIREENDEYENMVTDINKQTAIEKDIAISGDKTPSDLILSLNMLLDDKNIKGKTILDNRQVTAITLMNWAGQVYDIAFLREFVNEWCRYRISGDGGKGRADLISIAQALQLQRDKEREDYLSLIKK